MQVAVSRAVAPEVPRAPEPELDRRSLRIGVFDNNFASTLVLVQSLARAGVAMTVYDPGGRSVLSRSRYVDRVRPCPSHHDHERFPDWLRDQLARGAFDLVAPTSDGICYHIAETLDLVSPALRARLPSANALRDVLFKDRLAAACARNDIATPRTFAPTSVQSALRDAEILGYPVVLKPRSHACVPTERGCVVYSPQELVRHFVPYRLPDRERPLLERHPDVTWPLLQQYIDPQHMQYSCSGVLAPEGHVLASAASLKLDQSPHLLGVGTAFGGIDSVPLLAAGENVAARLLGIGLFEVELMQRDSATAPMVLDVNPRVFGQIGFDLLRGNDLPAVWHRSLTQHIDACPAPQPAGAVFLNPVPFLLSNLVRIITGPDRLKRLGHTLRLLWLTRGIYGWDRHDLRASLTILARPLRNPSTYMKSHVREARVASGG